MDGAERLSITQRGDDAAALALDGELDAYTAQFLEKRLSELSETDDVRLDLSALSFIDSTGIRAVVRSDNAHREAGSRLVLVDPSPSVMRLLQLTSLDDHLDIESAQ